MKNCQHFGYFLAVESEVEYLIKIPVTYLTCMNTWQYKLDNITLNLSIKVVHAFELISLTKVKFSGDLTFGIKVSNTLNIDHLKIMLS